MTKLIHVDQAELSLNEPPEKYCRELEEGNILFFSSCPFEFPKNELAFLLAQKQSGASNR